MTGAASGLHRGQNSLQEPQHRCNADTRTHQHMHTARHTLLLPHARTLFRHNWSGAWAGWSSLGTHIPAINKIILYNVGTRTETLRTNTSTQIKSNGQPDFPLTGGVPGPPIQPRPQRAKQASKRGQSEGRAAGSKLQGRLLFGMWLGS